MKEHKDGGRKRTGITGKHHDMKVLNPNNQRTMMKSNTSDGEFACCSQFPLHSCPSYYSVREITVLCLEMYKAILLC